MSPVAERQIVTALLTQSVGINCCDALATIPHQADHRADELIDRCLASDGSSPVPLLKKASILALQAR